MTGYTFASGQRTMITSWLCENPACRRRLPDGRQYLDPEATWRADAYTVCSAACLEKVKSLCWQQLADMRLHRLVCTALPGQCRRCAGTIPAWTKQVNLLASMSA